MKHFLLLTLLISFSITQTNGKSVDETTARKAAISFITSISSTSQLKSTTKLECVYRSPTSSNLKRNTSSNDANYFYIFSSAEDKKFAIVSGDDRALPILGYSTTSSFDPSNIPPNLNEWLIGYRNAIRYAIENNIKTNLETRNKWENLFNETHLTSEEIVAPLLTTLWDQSPFYNDLCPFSTAENERTVAGCAVTAMAQIMKYWNHPTYGTGSKSYVPKSYPELGIISADFGATQYNWASMPNQISAPNEAIAKLMFHCGVSIEMDYGTPSQGGSVAYMRYHNHPSVFLALRDNFGYKHSSSYEKKWNYSALGWKNILKAELDASRPVYYGAWEGNSIQNEPGHAFVCDGYNSNNYFHFNLGWGGYCDGYFVLDAVVLNGEDYSNKQVAIIGIEPITVNPSIDMRMSKKVAISPSVYIEPDQKITLETGFKNTGVIDFEGSFIAVISDTNYYPIHVMSNTRVFSLATGDTTGNLIFSKDLSTAIKEKNTASGEKLHTLAFLGLGTNSKLYGVQSGKDSKGNYPHILQLIFSNTNSITADTYENNNSSNTAYELVPTFKNDSTEFDIIANIHDTTDTDYYKIKLPPEYEYEIRSFLGDNNRMSLDTSVLYTFDGKYSIQLDNDSWSETVDYHLGTSIFSSANEYLYIKVEPYFTGYIGNYSLNLRLTRNEKDIVPVSTLLHKNGANIYPSPNNGEFIIKLEKEHLGTNKISIASINGKLISNMLLENHSVISKQINLNVAPGVYLVHINNNNTTTTRKVVVY